MKIYFIGSTSCGKTTLARYTADKYKLPMLTEVARLVLAEKELNLDTLRTNLDVAADYQRTVFERQFEEEKKYETFVSDRSVLDALAYTGNHTTILNELMRGERLQKYIETLKQPNTVVFFVRPSKACLKEDGIRETLVWESVIAIDAMVKFLLEQYGLDYIPIHAVPMQERVRLINGVLKYIQS